MGAEGTMADTEAAALGSPVPHPPATGPGAGGARGSPGDSMRRKWNTPAELHQLLYVVCGRRGPGGGPAGGAGYSGGDHDAAASSVGAGHAAGSGANAAGMPALVKRESNLKDLKGQTMRRQQSRKAKIKEPGEEVANGGGGESLTHLANGGGGQGTLRTNVVDGPSTTSEEAGGLNTSARRSSGVGFDVFDLPKVASVLTSEHTGQRGGSAGGAHASDDFGGGDRGRHGAGGARAAGGLSKQNSMFRTAMFAPDTPGMQESSRPRSMRGSTTSQVSGIVMRVNSAISLGNGVGFYTADDLMCHAQGDVEGVPCEVRISGSLFIVHHRYVDANSDPNGSGNHRMSVRPKMFMKLGLVNIVSVEMDGLRGCISMSVVPGDKDTLPPLAPLSARTPAAESRGNGFNRTSDSMAAAIAFEFITQDDQLLEEVLHCLLQQQTKAYQAEIGKLRKSLMPKGTKTLDIVHFNDVYHLSVHKKEEPCGGLTRFYHALEDIRRKKNPLVLFSGDFVGPSLMSVITKGKQMIDALNFIGTHYGVFGNHEFDFGLRNLERIVHGYTQGEYIFAGSTATWLMTNMDGKNGLPLGNVERRKLLEWNGIMIGIVGLCENWLPHCPRLQKDEASYRDIFEVGEAEAQALKEQGAKVVIALTHNRLAMDKHVTSKCPSIDLLLGGHDHFYKKDIDSRVIKSGEEFQWLSEVQLRIHEDEDAQPPTIQCRTHPISSDLPENEMVDKLVQRYGEKMRERMGKPIGCTAVPLDSTEEACRFNEGALTNFLADLMQDETSADCAVLGGAAVAGKVLQDAGVITIGDVFNWFPDEIKVQVVEMSGYWLEQMLNRSVVECPNEAPSFPHPSSNLLFTLSLIGTPTVSDVMIKGDAIDHERTYQVAVTDFVAAGKERFKFVKEHCKVLTDSEHAEQFSMWVLEYFRRRQTKVENVAAPEKERDHVNPQQVTHQPKRRRRSSFHNEPDQSHEGFELMDEDLLDLGEGTMRLLMKSLMNVSEETSPQQTQTSIKAAVKKLLDCDRATIFLVDPVRQQLRFLPDGSTSEVRIPIAAGIAGNCATSGEVLNIPDAYQDPRFNQAVDKQTGYRTYNILAIPVKRKDGSVVAVMQAVNKRDNEPFTTTDAKILNLFGKQTAITLGHAEVFESLKKNQEATNTLLKVARDIASDVSMDMNTMIACIMSGSSQLLQSDRSSLFLVDSAAQEMWTIIIDPATGGETIVRLPVGTGLAGHTAVTGQILNLADAYDSDLFNSEFDKKSGYRTKQVLCVPIFTSEESSDVLGVLQFINKIDGSDFSKQDEATAEAFASFAGISIANTQEIDLLKLKNDEKQYQEMPPPTMGRILIKGGWSTVKKVLLNPVSRKALVKAMQDDGLASSTRTAGGGGTRRNQQTSRIGLADGLLDEDACAAVAGGSLSLSASNIRRLQSARMVPTSMRQRAPTGIFSNRVSLLGEVLSSHASQRGSTRANDVIDMNIPEPPAATGSPTHVSEAASVQPAPIVTPIVAGRSMVRRVSLGGIPHTQSWTMTGIGFEEVDSCSGSDGDSPKHRIPERRGSQYSAAPGMRGMAC